MILEVSHVSKDFGGLRAVEDVSFQLAEGEILGLIGPNGAGKTTLFNCVNGVYPPTSGNIVFQDRSIVGLRPYQVAHLGMARTHQIVRPLNDLTVRENVIVGACYGHKHYGLGEAAEIADAVMERVGLETRSTMVAASLNVAQKKRLELARALAAQPFLILLDEVLAGLNPSEVTAMLDTIRDIRDGGITIIMIEHIMHAIMNVSDRIIVLNSGAQIAEGTPTEVAQDPLVIEAYLGDPELAARLWED